MSDGRPKSPQSDDKSTLSDAELAARKAKLQAAMDAHHKAEKAAREPQSGTSMAGYAAAFRLSTEFIAGIAVGTLIGWMIDQVAGTAPFAMIVFLMLGFVAGIFNVMRAAGLMADPHARLPGQALAEEAERKRRERENTNGAP